MMRLIHRWISFPLIIFLLAVTITGIYLQWKELEAEMQPHSEVAAPTATFPSDEAVLEQVATALQQAREQDASFPVQKLEYVHKGDRQTVTIATTQRIGPSIKINLNTGEIVQEARPKRTLRTYFILLHSGKYFGVWGVIIIMIAGLILLVLSITGFIVYLDMYRRRLKQGRKKLFW